MSNSDQQAAIWTPGWYELDQALALGQRQKFWFFQTVPDSMGGLKDDGHSLVFFNKTDTSENCEARFARIDEMHHSQLGAIQRIDTDGLDYIFFPIEGEEVIVNAEEEPGQAYDLGESISDWSIHVKLVRCQRTRRRFCVRDSTRFFEFGVIFGERLKLRTFLTARGSKSVV